jgi:predicted amidohydrolase
LTRVACQQLAPLLGDLPGNAARAQAAIDSAIAAGAEVVLLPELCTSGYMFADPEEAAASAISRDDPILVGWAQSAEHSGVVVAGGFCELGDDGQVYNSAVTFPGLPGAEPAFYRKLHLWDREKLVFKPGSVLPPVFETGVGRAALIICYDLEFPELTRALALAGTQLLLVPTNWPAVPRPDGERPPEAVIAMAAARTNRMAIAIADRCGSERGQDWTQGTTIISADGWVAAESREPGMLIGEVDCDVALDKRLTDQAHLFNDRRPEFYGSLTVAAADNPR